MIAQYERSKSYESVLATFDELERMLRVDPNPKPANSRPAKPARKPEFDASTLEEGALDLFADS